MMTSRHVSELLDAPPVWETQAPPTPNIVQFSRIQVIRNLDIHLFPSRAEKDELSDIRDSVQTATTTLADFSNGWDLDTVDISTAEEELLNVEIDGEAHIAWGHPTRDQYLGAFLGTAAIAMLVEDVPELSARARTIALRMLDYLDQTGWAPTNGFNDGVSTVFITLPSQVLAYYALGNELDPERYG